MNTIAALYKGCQRHFFLAGGSFHGKRVGTGWFLSLIPPSKCSLQTQQVLVVTTNVCFLEIYVSHKRLCWFLYNLVIFYVPCLFRLVIPVGASRDTAGMIGHSNLRMENAAQSHSQSLYSNNTCYMIHYRTVEEVVYMHSAAECHIYSGYGLAFYTPYKPLQRDMCI